MQILNSNLKVCKEYSGKFIRIKIYFQLSNNKPVGPEY